MLLSKTEHGMPVALEGTPSLSQEILHEYCQTAIHVLAHSIHDPGCFEKRAYRGLLLLSTQTGEASTEFCEVYSLSDL